MVEVEAEGLLAEGDDLGRQVVRLDHRAGRGDHGLLDHVLELADVPGPVVAEQSREGLPGHGLGRQPALDQLLEEVVHQERHVLEPFPERRELDRDHVEPIEKVLAEPMLGDGLGEVAIGRCDHAAVGPDRLGPPDPLEPLVLEHAEQLGLHAEGDLADLVEQQRAPAGLLESPLPLAVGAGERASLVAEELALQQVFREAPRS